jgi:ketosteroid isomerase-like protein
LNNAINAATNSITQFFQALEQETIAGNFPALAERFSETFLAASPSGAKVAQRSLFAQMLPARKEQFENMARTQRSWSRSKPQKLMPATPWPGHAGS